MNLEVKHPYTRDREAGRVRVTFPEDEGRTKQAFKNECDINRIMDRFQKTGAITHLAKYGPQYGDASSTDLLECMQILADAQRMFEDLPSNVRKRFPGPAEFLDFVQDESNAEELYSLGLAVRPSTPDPLLVRVQPEPDPEPAPG